MKKALVVWGGMELHTPERGAQVGQLPIAAAETDFLAPGNVLGKKILVAEQLLDVVIRHYCQRCRDQHDQCQQAAQPPASF